MLPRSDIVTNEYFPDDIGVLEDLYLFGKAHTFTLH